MKYNRYIACAVNKDENSLFGFIPVVNDSMMDYIVSAISLFENMAQNEYHVDKDDVMVETIDYNSIAFNAILSYNDRAQWNFEHLSDMLVRAFVQVLINEGQHRVAEALMHEVYDTDL